MKTAVITGGAGGLGRALAKILQAEGWHTALIDLPGKATLETRQTPQQSVYACDLTDMEALEATATRIRAAHRTIDLVIYNAGITQIGAFGEMSLETQRRVFEVNYFAQVATARAFLADIRAAKGTHLAISSVAGFTPLYHRTAYAASKHALEGFFKSLRSEEQAHGVQTLIAAPSFVATNPGNPEARDGGIARPGSATDGIDYMRPAQAARIIVTGLNKGREMILVGRVARAAWWINRLSPRLFQTLMQRNMTK